MEGPGLGCCFGGRTKQLQVMDTVLWIAQIFLAFVFAYSGVMKSTQSEQKLVAMGQTGVAHLPQPLIRFIGISELIGVVGLLLPGLTHQPSQLTALSAGCLGLIMIPAAIIHYRRGEIKTVGLNIGLLIVCLFVAWGRL